uniref:Uncharacterized protein n=1 Tax=Arundo donax TaxID=35708 RepID=A0A0A9FZ60_ARUDO
MENSARFDLAIPHLGRTLPNSSNPRPLTSYQEPQLNSQPNLNKNRSRSRRLEHLAAETPPHGATSSVASSGPLLNKKNEIEQHSAKEGGWRQGGWCFGFFYGFLPEF